MNTEYFSRKVSGSENLSRLRDSASRNATRLKSYVKTKKDTYMNGSISQSGDELSATSLETIPSDTSRIVLYPSYTRFLAEENVYEVHVRGWVFTPGIMNRKNRIILTLARQLVGKSRKSIPEDGSSVNLAEGYESERISTVGRGFERDSYSDCSVSSSSERSDITSSEFRDEQARPASCARRRFLSASSSSLDSMGSSSTASDRYTIHSRNSDIDQEMKSLSPSEKLLRERLAPFMYKSVSRAKVSVEVTYSNEPNAMRHFRIEDYTDANGKFSMKFKLPKKPDSATVSIATGVYETEEIMEVSGSGVSIITDIDDTIKHTGVKGDKRELFRNIFLNHVSGWEVPGVADWFNLMYYKGASVHYVSNSPWQLYPAISEFLSLLKFPRGSIHLKQYSGLLNGLFEPAAERKRATLNQIVRDFPRKKFLLLGDSGEQDLEAYVDLARVFPDQIMAILIRTVGEIDTKEAKLWKESLNKRPDEFGMRNNQPLRRKRSPEVHKNDSIHDNSSDNTRSSVSTPSIPSTGITKKPPVPRKPSQLRSNLIETGSMKPPELPPRRKPPPSLSQVDSSENSSSMEMQKPPKLPARPEPINSHHSSIARNSNSDTPISDPVVMPSSQNDYGQLGVDKTDSFRQRLTIARKSLPPSILIDTWCTGTDLLDSTSLLLGDIERLCKETLQARNQAYQEDVKKSEKQENSVDISEGKLVDL